jgi:hypothetical protein
MNKVIQLIIAQLNSAHANMILTIGLHMRTFNETFSTGFCLILGVSMLLNNKELAFLTASSIPLDNFHQQLGLSWYIYTRLLNAFCPLCSIKNFLYQSSLDLLPKASVLLGPFPTLATQYLVEAKLDYLLNLSLQVIFGAFLQSYR